MKVLDLYCGGGGASVGLKRAGFDKIVGIDIKPQPEYPFEFHCADIFNMEYELGSTLYHIFYQFDFIWASPPCQAYSIASRRYKNSKHIKYPELIRQTRELLQRTGKPFIIENVPLAPIRKDLLLCGEMFGLKVIRHRIFEIHGFSVRQPEHKKHKGLVKDGHYVTVAGNGGNNNGHNYCKLNGLEGMTKLNIWQNAMGILWITNLNTLAQAVPPAYSNFIGKEYLKEKEDSCGGK